MENISIIVVDYNSHKDTLECLESLKKIKKSKYKCSIIVVDNGSIKPLELPTRLKEKHVDLLRSESNLGFTGGNNLGIKHAIEDRNADYVLLLNNDTTVHPDFLKAMMSCLQSEVNIGAVGAKIYFSKGREFHKGYSADQKGRVLWYAGGSLDWQHLVAFHRGVDEVDRGQFDQQSQTDFITGCAMLMPVSVLDRVGLLDEDYFLYLEDVDLSLRIANAGYVLKFCPEAVVWHKNAGSSGGVGSIIHQYYQARNRIAFGLKYLYPKRRWQLIRIMLQLFFFGEDIHKRAVKDAIFKNMGKQPVI